jgi:hypothetical protein
VQTANAPAITGKNAIIQEIYAAPEMIMTEAPTLFTASFTARPIRTGHYVHRLLTQTVRVKAAITALQMEEHGNGEHAQTVATAALVNALSRKQMANHAAATMTASAEIVQPAQIRNVTAHVPRAANAHLIIGENATTLAAYAAQAIQFMANTTARLTLTGHYVHRLLTQTVRAKAAITALQME